MAKQRKKTTLEIPVSFGGISFGKKTARVGVTVDRSHLSLSKADENLCDRRLVLTIKATANGDQAGQGRFEGMEDDLTLSGVADVKGFGVHSSTIGFGLTFNVREIRKIAAETHTALNDFASREGTIKIASSEEIPEEDEAEGEGEDMGEDQE